MTRLGKATITPRVEWEINAASWSTCIQEMRTRRSQFDPHEKGCICEQCQMCWLAEAIVATCPASDNHKHFYIDSSYCEMCCAPIGALR